jgi:thymidine kinase
VRNGSKDKEVNLVGGDELYKPVCRNCYYKFLEKEKLHLMNNGS